MCFSGGFWLFLSSFRSIHCCLTSLAKKQRLAYAHNMVASVFHCLDVLAHLCQFFFMKQCSHHLFVRKIFKFLNRHHACYKFVAIKTFHLLSNVLGFLAQTTFIEENELIPFEHQRQRNITMWRWKISAQGCFLLQMILSCGYILLLMPKKTKDVFKFCRSIVCKWRN